MIGWAVSNGVPNFKQPKAANAASTLVGEPDKLITHQQLLQQVWGPSYSTETNYLRVHLANLRRKLEPDPGRPRYLITEPGIGYRFQPDEQIGPAAQE